MTQPPSCKVLTPENRHEMLPRFFHRSRREAMEVAAEVRPAEAAPRREVVTAVRLAEPPAAMLPVAAAALLRANCRSGSSG